MMHHTISYSGGSTLADLQQALEDYLPVLLGLVENGKTCFSLFILDECSLHNLFWLIAYLYCAGSHLQYKIQFAWVNQEDDAEVIPTFLVHVFLLWFVCLSVSVYNIMLIIFYLLHFLFVCWCNCIFPGNSHVKCLVWSVVSFALDGYTIIITGQFITSSQNVHWWSSA